MEDKLKTLLHVGAQIAGAELEVILILHDSMQEITTSRFCSFPHPGYF